MSDEVILTPEQVRELRRPWHRVVSAYWNLRWFVWDARDWLFVKEAMRQLQRDHVVYVHPRTGGEAKAALIRLDVVDHETAEPHGHVEGR